MLSGLKVGDKLRATAQEVKASASSPSAAPASAAAPKRLFVQSERPGPTGPSYRDLGTDRPGHRT